ncbi:MAG TPA: ABC transporter permease [Stellaceae bacterium]|nr:ABC transporter permease [Stellaceae bacterium]
MAANTRNSANPAYGAHTATLRNGWEASLLAAGEFRIRLFGEWVLASGAHSPAELSRRLSQVPRATKITFDTQDLTAWDNILIEFLNKLETIAGERGVSIDRSGLPGGARRLLALARAVPERQGARRTQTRPDLLTRVGASSQTLFAATADFFGFLGEACVAIGRLIVGKARLRRSDLLLAIEDCGPSALPIVALVSFLIGLILAFVGAVELRRFGAAIYVADLVGIGMVRELAAMMTAILMSGRTGAAFAANLGTMQVSDEISALQTLGIPPMEFLVLPRIVALVMMMPLLAIFANIVGMLGGLLIGGVTLDISPVAYYHQTSGAVGLNDWAIGLVKAAIFGAIVAVVGCWRGMRCSRSAAAVGDAATSAVVLCIVLIIVVDAIATVLCTTLNI